MVYWGETQMWRGATEPQMTFAGEAKGASCGEQSMLRLQQGIEGLVGRKNSISPGCHREKDTLE